MLFPCIVVLPYEPMLLSFHTQVVVSTILRFMIFLVFKYLWITNQYFFPLTERDEPERLPLKMTVGVPSNSPPSLDSQLGSARDIKVYMEKWLVLGSTYCTLRGKPFINIFT